MTDQKQAPERIWARPQEPGDDYGNWGLQREPVDVEFIRKDLHDALAKQRDELAAENEKLNDEIASMQDEFSDLEIERNDINSRRIKAEAERDQALAASAAREIAMRDRAAAEVPKEHMVTGYMIRSISDIQKAIHALPLSPDGQQALDDVRADAWREGWTAREYGKSAQDNPHRTGGS